MAEFNFAYEGVSAAPHFPFQVGDETPLAGFLLPPVLLLPNSRQKLQKLA